MKKYLLVGTPNCGKTMLFNRLTGGHMRVANFPGITVEKKEGKLKFMPGTVIDLPGTYSLNAFSPEEKVSRSVLFEDDYDVIINVLDGTSPEKGLSLTLQLLQLKKPLVVVVNLYDLCEKQGVFINYKLLVKLLGVPVIPVSAKTGKNISLLLEKMKNPPPCNPADYSAEDICALCVKRSGADTLSRKVDKIVLHPVFSPLFFLLVFSTMFLLVLSPPVSHLSSFLEKLFSETLTGMLEDMLKSLRISFQLTDFILEGLLRGVSSVLAFLPQMSVLFFLMTLLEDSGYMARAAFIADRPLSFIGLSGSSFVPFLMGLGCSTSAILSARTTNPPGCRFKTILALPFISCGAKLPLYLLFMGTFFPGRRLFLTLLMYLPGFILLIISCILFGKSSDSFILELPPYRMPSLKNLLTETRIRIQGFITRAGTVIFLFSALMWLLQHISLGKTSLLEIIGGLFCFIFTPLGFGFPEASSSLLAGCFAKEAIVSSLAVLTGAAGISGFFTASSALSFVVFASLYPACISALAVMRKEIGTGATVFSFIYQFLCAYLCASVVYFVALFLGI